MEEYAIFGRAEGNVISEDVIDPTFNLTWSMDGSGLDPGQESVLLITEPMETGLILEGSEEPNRTIEKSHR